MDERRGAERKSYVAFVWYRLISDVENGDEDGEPPQEGIAHSTDLSLDGLGIVAPRQLAIGRKAFMKIKAPKGTISVVAVVINSRRLDDGTHKVGFRFDIIPPSDRPVLTQMVEP